MMLNHDEFEIWCQSINLSDQARKVIEQIRSSQPSRLVGGGRKNVTGRYPSHKMGVTIQFESHKVELPFIYQMEYDNDVLEFYDQPPPIKISYQAETGRNISFFSTPDFFVIRSNSAGWVECKTENNLQKLSEKNPNRYFLGEDNRWLYPPGEKYAEQFGLFFHIWSDSQVNWVLQRNFNFLEDYYYHNDVSVLESAKGIVISLVSAQPGITLAQLLQDAEETCPDDIYFLIATQQIYFDLTAAPLVEPEVCFIFRDQQTAVAYKSIVLSQTTTNNINCSLINLVSGTSVIYDGKILTISFIGETSILLHTEEKQLIELPMTAFHNLVTEGNIIGLKNGSTDIKDSLNDEIRDILLKASKKDLKDANRRYSIIEPWLRGQAITDSPVSQRTLQHWRSKYVQAQQKYGYGYIGLLSSDNVKGNRNRKLPEHTIKLIEKFIDEEYENYKQKRKSAVYGAFVNALSADGIPDHLIPSYKTFIKEIKRRSGYEQTLNREGHRAAYSQEPFFWELKLTTPRHGDRPFEIGHIDHTPVDIELRCSRTGKVLGKAWVTFLIDAYTRRILAVYITFDPPSYRSCMMVLRICVKRHGRLPQIIVTDNGPEFHSTYYQSLIALFHRTVKYRPPSKARFNAVGERLFGTAMTQLVYNLAGNTQITKKVRLMTKSVNPKNLALWTLDLFYYYLSEWAYEVYDTREHPALGQSPREAYTDGIAKFGSRSHRMISYDENFKLLTLPTTDKGKAKVDPNQGVQINYIHYWSNAFRNPTIQKTFVHVRYDPFNAAIAYVYVDGQWVECISEHYSTFQGKSEKEIDIATCELRKRHQKHAQNFKVRAKQLAAFISTAEAEEVLLEQRLRDAQGKEVFRLIEGGLPNRSPYGQVQEIANDNSQDSRDSKPQSLDNTSSNVSKLQIYSEY
ncbi:MAG: DDE-type integrase/transposase/recombinase [Aulosira sp. DedQUE10]|nr:DDE-type integrase/transposase/recombinase [Aulosira sp. DedQUE10]